MTERDDAPPATALDRALRAVHELVVDVLGSPSKTRFHEAAAICTLGQQMVKILSVRVEDFEDHDGAGYHPNVIIGPNMMADEYPPRRRARQWVNDNQAQRDMALASVPTMQTALEATRAQGAMSEARELATLVDLQSKIGGELQEARLRTAARFGDVRDKVAQEREQPAIDAHEKKLKTIQTRIDALMRAMEERNASAAVVSADVSRGHPAREPGGEDDPLRQRGHAVGNGGAPGPAEACGGAAAVP